MPGAPHIHRFIDMHDLGDMLVGAGFADPVMDTETITLTYADLPAMVRDLRETGQTCALQSRSRGLLGPRRWQTLTAALQPARHDGRLPATIEVVYGHAWKAPPRRTAEGHAIVKLPSDSRSRR
jgi:malonyl-CoA O-methyltransferase